MSHVVRNGCDGTIWLLATGTTDSRVWDAGASDPSSTGPKEVPLRTDSTVAVMLGSVHLLDRLPIFSYLPQTMTFANPAIASQEQQMLRSIQMMPG